MKTCSSGAECLTLGGPELPESEFTSEGTTSTGKPKFRSRCKACYAARQRVVRKAPTAEQKRLQQARYRANKKAKEAAAAAQSDPTE